MNSVGESVVTVMVAIIGLASLAVLVSRNATTVPLVGAVSKGFSGALGVAISPVTGASGFGNNSGFSPGGNLY